MSNYTRRRQPHDADTPSRELFAKTERELAEGYLEVEITGLTLRRLLVAYSIIFRNAWAHTLDGLRSLLRPTPVH